MTSLFSMSMQIPTIPHSIPKHKTADQLRSGYLVLLSSEETSSRRQLLLGCCGISIVSCQILNWGVTPLPACAGDESNDQEDKDEDVVGAIKSFFDPNEKTKSGKVLPKAYVKSAREVVKTLLDSLKEDPKDIAKFRRIADAAKESIRDYLNNWRGQKTVVNEESYVLLEKTIRSLAGFYSKAGPSAPLPEKIKSSIVGDLSKVEELL